MEIKEEIQKEMKENERNNRLRKILVVHAMISFVMIFLAKCVSAYSLDPKMPPLWDIFVETVFGGFWLAVLCLSFIMFILIGPIGGISPFTTGVYLLLFLFTMAMGYGYAPISVMLFAVLVTWSAYQMVRYFNIPQT